MANYSDLVRQLIEATTTGRDSANQANEARYSQLIELLTGLRGKTEGAYDQVRGHIGSLGGMARERIRRGSTRDQAAARQDLITRGLGNTTIRDSVLRGIRSDAEFQQQGVDEQQAGLRAGALERQAGADRDVAGMLARAIEGRTDAGPDMSQYANLIQQLSQAQTQAQPRTINAGVNRPSGSLRDSLRSRFGMGGAGVASSGGGQGGGGQGGGGQGGGGAPVSGVQVVRSTAPDPNVKSAPGVIGPGQPVKKKQGSSGWGANSYLNWFR